MRSHRDHGFGFVVFPLECELLVTDPSSPPHITPNAGELQCIGTAAQLKRRFGAGYTFYVSSSLHRDDVAASTAVLSRFATS